MVQPVALRGFLKGLSKWRCRKMIWAFFEKRGGKYLSFCFSTTFLCHWGTTMLMKWRAVTAAVPERTFSRTRLWCGLLSATSSWDSVVIACWGIDFNWISVDSGSTKTESDNRASISKGQGVYRRFLHLLQNLSQQHPPGGGNDISCPSLDLLYNHQQECPISSPSNSRKISRAK